MEKLDMFIHSTDNEKILERLYKEPDETMMSGGMLDYEAYLKLPATDEYQNNKERLQRIVDESKGIFKVLSNKVADTNLAHEEVEEIKPQ